MSLADKISAVVTAIGAELKLKADVASLSTVATSGSYNDLDDKPSGGGGGVSFNPTLTVADFNAAAGDVVFVLASDVTVTLPNPAAHGDRVEVVLGDPGADPVEVSYFDIVTQGVVTVGAGARAIFYYGDNVDIGLGPVSGWARAA